jgi:2-polyprenyl-6-methoxyphenol hydroxylase-like FAD-dependent oxidoreductase
MTIVKTRPKRTLVIGGGIAGTVAAMALQRAGHEPVVYEAYDRGSDGVGAFLTLAVNGLAALAVLDLEGLVGHLGMDTPAMTIVSGSRGPLGTFPMQGRTVERALLYAALRDEAVRRGIEVQYGKRLHDAQPGSTGVRARFADGTTADGHLLVGADGLRSRTRSLIDPDAPRARHIGLLNTGGYAHGLELPGEPGVAHFVFGRRCFFGYFIHPDRRSVWWFANPPSPREPSPDELAAIPPGRWRARLLDLFAADDGPMRDIIAATEEIFPAWNTYDFPRVPRWSADRMVIIGDAVHATSPSSGQGASLAIEDGVVLGRCLRDIDDVATAFAHFTTLRQDRVERVVRQGKRNGDGKAQGPVGAWLRDRMLPMLMARMTRRNSLGWITDHRIDWNEVACP